jgi:DNA-binding transcriptional MerR regulator
MKTLTTSEVARQAGVNPARLGYWLSTGKVRRPKMLATGGRIVCLWTEADIERIRVYSAKVRRHTTAANSHPDREAANDETV